MASRSWPRRSSMMSWVSRRQFGCHSDPVIYADGRSQRNKKTRKPVENLERVSKRTSRTSSPHEGCSQAFSGPYSSSSLSVYTDASEMPEEPRSSSEAEFTVDVKTSSEKTSKRKSEDSPERGSKRSRGSESSHEGCSQALSGPSSSAHSSLNSVYTEAPEMPEESQSLSNEMSTEKTSKRKSDESLERASKRSRGSPSVGPSSSFSSSSVPSNSSDAFKAKYRVQEMLGQGSHGSVYAGERKKDNLHVAIKEIPQHFITRTPMLLNGKMTMVPLEVALLLTLKPAESETSAVVTLLDWFDLTDVLILVLERPEPCMDLFDYIRSGRGTMEEHKAKIITRQLMDALIEIHSKGVFHGDIKTDNILIETGSDVPRVRIIDFSCGAFLSDTTDAQRRVFLCSPPERWRNSTIHPEPTTVWQLGLVLFEMLHGCFAFRTAFAIMYKDVIMNNSFSTDCQDFVLSCLKKDPGVRPTFAMLKDHPWLT